MGAGDQLRITYRDMKWSGLVWRKLMGVVRWDDQAVNGRTERPFGNGKRSESSSVCSIHGTRWM